MIEITIKTKQLKIQINKLLDMADDAIKSDDPAVKYNCLFKIKEGLKHLSVKSEESFIKEGNINVRINE